MTNIDNHDQANPTPFLNLGFRPFFFAAGLSATILMILWFMSYQLTITLPLVIAPQLWHAHEMIFGYGMAVIVGFLLTAVSNWTGVKTIHGQKLLGLFLLWLLARLLPFISGFPMIALAIIDTSFLIFATIAIAQPIIKTKSWRNIGIVSKILLLTISHGLFYLGLLGMVDNGIMWGLYTAFYLILALIFVLARRVVPFFIKRGVASDKPLINYRWLDRASLILFVIYAVGEVFWQQPILHLIAFLLFGLHSYRLFLWYRPKIWGKPLLWSLYLAYSFLTIGFFIKTLAFFVVISPFIIIHAFAIGVGLMTIGMMSRVVLGHTARNIFEPPKILFLVFLSLALTFVFRVILPVIDPDNYLLWIGITQVLWIIAFAMFSIIYSPMLFTKRIDGRFG
jgi:uncharacterized protein involved in response to NO